MVLVLFHVRVQCRFHASAGQVQAGTMRDGVGADWLPAPCTGRVRVNSYGRGVGAGQKFQPMQSSRAKGPDMYGSRRVAWPLRSRQSPLTTPT